MPICAVLPIIVRKSLVFDGERGCISVNIGYAYDIFIENIERKAERQFLTRLHRFGCRGAFQLFSVCVKNRDRGENITLLDYVDCEDNLVIGSAGLEADRRLGYIGRRELAGVVILLVKCVIYRFSGDILGAVMGIGKGDVVFDIWVRDFHLADKTGKGSGFAVFGEVLVVCPEAQTFFGINGFFQLAEIRIEFVYRYPSGADCVLTAEYIAFAEVCYFENTRPFFACLLSVRVRQNT